MKCQTLLRSVADWRCVFLTAKSCCEITLQVRQAMQLRDLLREKQNQRKKNMAEQGTHIANESTTS